MKRYAVLFGHSPADANNEALVKEDKEFGSPGGYFQRQLLFLLKKDNLSKGKKNSFLPNSVSENTDRVTGLPKIVQDTKDALGRLAEDPSRMTNPFESIYRLIFQLTIRTVGCDEIAEDRELQGKVLKLFETIDKSTTTAVCPLPQASLFSTYFWSTANSPAVNNLSRVPNPCSDQANYCWGSYLYDL